SSGSLTSAVNSPRLAPQASTPRSMGPVSDEPFSTADTPRMLAVSANPGPLRRETPSRGLGRPLQLAATPGRRKFSGTPSPFRSVAAKVRVVAPSTYTGIPATGSRSLTTRPTTSVTAAAHAGKNHPVSQTSPAATISVPPLPTVPLPTTVNSLAPRVTA